MSLPARQPHGGLLKRKSAELAVLKPCYTAYLEFCNYASQIEVVDRKSVLKLVELFNEYRQSAIYIFEDGKNVPQENLRSTLSEELFGWLFKDLFIYLDIAEPANFVAGKTVNSYLNLTFSPRNFPSLFDNPNPRIGKKDQDFAIGAAFTLDVSQVGGSSSYRRPITIPIIAIECKTYLAKNHLDMCSSTAQMLKRANPYCMYMIAAEFLKMDPGVTPEVTDIAEIFVLCKADNASRRKRKEAGDPPHPIYGDVIFEIFRMVTGHLKAVWWDPDTALERGKIISRPF